MDKIALKQRLRIATTNLLELHESKNLVDWELDLLKRSIINLELAKMELNK